MNVAAILRHDGYQVVHVAPTARIAEVAQTLAHTRASAAMVVDRFDQLLGIVSEQDVVRGLAANGPRLLDMTAGQLMTRPIRAATPQTPLGEAMRMIAAGGFRHLPVSDRGALLGLVSMADLVRACIIEEDHAFVA